METLREERESQYHNFCVHELVYESKDFGSFRTPRNVVCKRIEIRLIKGKYRPGCIQRAQSDSGEIRFRWFDLFDDEISSRADCIAYCDDFIAGFQDAENEHRSAGIEQYQRDLINSV